MKNCWGLVPPCSKSHSNIHSFHSFISLDLSEYNDFTFFSGSWGRRSFTKETQETESGGARASATLLFALASKVCLQPKRRRRPVIKPRKSVRNPKLCRNFRRRKNVTSHFGHFILDVFQEVAEQLKAAGVQAANLLEEPVDLLPPASSPSLFQKTETWPLTCEICCRRWHLLYDWMGQVLGRSVLTNFVFFILVGTTLSIQENLCFR